MMIDNSTALMAQTQAQANMEKSTTAQISALAGNGKSKTVEAAKEAGKKFESMFLSQMLNHMFEGIKTDPVFGGGAGETMFRSMQIQQYADQMAKAGGLGIADAVTREILKAQEGHAS